jgi:hypothetical protein
MINSAAKVYVVVSELLQFLGQLTGTEDSAPN